MTADGSVRAIVDALALPTGARVDARVPKKLLIEQGAPTSTDKRAIQEGVDELQWFAARSEEHTSELQSLMRISYAVFCLKKKKETKQINNIHTQDAPA